MAQSKLEAALAQKKVLLCCTIESGTPANVEIAAMSGFDVVWAEIEHANTSWSEAENLCRAANLRGAFSLMRVADADRGNIMHALDTGVDILVVPMVNDVATARRIVELGKFPPLGRRGFAGSVRGLDFGIGGRVEAAQTANRETHLFVQIETAEAVERCAEIVGVEGISGGLVGPSDLSWTLGKPMQFDDPAFVETYAGAIRQIRSLGKIAATATVHPTLLAAARDAGIQILCCATERASLRLHWEPTIKDIRAKMAG